MEIALDFIVLPLFLGIAGLLWVFYLCLSHDKDSDLNPHKHDLDAARKLEH